MTWNLRKNVICPAIVGFFPYRKKLQESGEIFPAVTVIICNLELKKSTVASVSCSVSLLNRLLTRGFLHSCINIVKKKYYKRICNVIFDRFKKNPKTLRYYSRDELSVVCVCA